MKEILFKRTFAIKSCFTPSFLDERWLKRNPGNPVSFIIFWNENYVPIMSSFNGKSPFVNFGTHKWVSFCYYTEKEVRHDLYNNDRTSIISL